VVEDHDQSDPRNPVYTGRLYWNRLDFRAVKQGDGPLVRRDREHWIQAAHGHEALIPDDWFERVQAEMHRRHTGQASPRRRTPNRFYVLGGIVHCATGHNPLRMQGKTRKGITYYACGYRISYGDKAAQALGHGKWHYVREDRITNLIDHFFATRIFGSARIDRFKAQHADLARELQDRDDGQRQRLTSQLTDIDQRLQRQLAAIEAGVDAMLVGDRIRALKAERQQVELAIAHIDDDRRARTDLDLDCAVGLSSSARARPRCDGRDLVGPQDGDAVERAERCRAVLVKLGASALSGVGAGRRLS
jgi:hypothetical protein